MRSAVIVEAKRTPVGRGVKGTYAATRPEQLGAVVIEALKPLLKDWSGLEDVLVGCAMPEGEQGMNMARLISFRAGLPITAGAATINRFCGSSQETMLMAARAIMTNQGDIFLAGGVESMSKVPMMGFNPSVDPFITETYPQAYCSMGITAENLAREYKITRRDQDEFAYSSHQKAAAAWKAGKYEKEWCASRLRAWMASPSPCSRTSASARTPASRNWASSSPRSWWRRCHRRQQLPRHGWRGLPAGDGRGPCQVPGSEARARIIGGAVAGVEPERMGIGPVPAVKKVLDRFGMRLDQIDAMELNEAFAAQSLAVSAKAATIPPR